MNQAFLTKIKTEIVTYARLIRWVNLAMVLVIVFSLRYGLFLPLYSAAIISSPLSHTVFFLVLLSIVLITAAGYVVNDIYDQKIDRLNKPEKLIIGQALSVSRAWMLYFAFNILGLAAGIVAALKIEQPILIWIFVLTFGLLWYYSAYLKRKLFWGNFLVAILSSLVIITPWLFEIYALMHNSDKWIAFFRFYPTMNYIVLSLSLFAFISTLIREIIKDAEDIQGDGAYQYQTLPIVLGWKTSKTIVQALIVLMMILLAVAQYWLRSRHYDFAFYWYFIIQFLSVHLLSTLPAEIHKNQLKRCSTIAKILMLIGILGIYTLTPFLIPKA